MGVLVSYDLHLCEGKRKAGIETSSMICWVVVVVENSNVEGGCVGNAGFVGFVGYVLLYKVEEGSGGAEE